MKHKALGGKKLVGFRSKLVSREKRADPSDAMTYDMWKWPTADNRWNTNQRTAKRPDPDKTLYTSVGPSKRTKNKRLAKGKRVKSYKQGF